MVKRATLLTLLLAVAPLHAEVTREAFGSRIELGELIPSAPESLHGVDLGRSPPPGSSRLISRGEVERQILAAGFELTGLTVPESTRVRAPGKNFTAPELASLARPAVERALPRGVELSSLSVACGLTLAPDASIGNVVVPKIPKRPGSVRVGLSVEVTANGEVTHHLTAMAVVKLGDQATQSEVSRGSVVRLVVQRKTARIEAEAVALANADVGEVIPFRVTVSNKTVRARVISPHEAVVVEGI